MEREFNLFPLIFGLVLAAAGAFAWYASASPRPEAKAAAASPPTIVRAQAATAAPPVASVSAAPESSPPVPAPTVAMLAPSAPAAPAPSSGPRIWQCEVNGQRVFADYQCSKDATPREVSEVNGMKATPAPPRRVGYPPPTQSYPEPYYEGGESEAGASGPVYLPYPVAYAVRVHPPHPHHPQPHTPQHHY